MQELNGIFKSNIFVDKETFSNDQTLIGSKIYYA